MAEKILEIRNLKKYYGKGDSEVKALDDVSFDVYKGEMLVLLGNSGCGKSTLLNIIGGMDSPTSGQVLLNGEDITAYKDKELTKYRKEKIGFIFQFYNLIQNLSVEENILLPIKMAGKNVPNYKEKLDEILEITGLTEKRNHKPSQLSGGQQQRVSIARAVLSEPEILLADEPTGNLDSKSTTEIMELFKRINEEKGITFLQVTHSMETAEYGSRIIRLDSGKLVG